MLNDVLSNVVSVLVLDKCGGMRVEFLEYGCLSIFVAVLEHSLDDTAAIRVCGERMDVPVECLDDELDMLRRYAFDGLKGELDPARHELPRLLTFCTTWLPF